jgi:hypothetical protein
MARRLRGPTTPLTSSRRASAPPAVSSSRSRRCRPTTRRLGARAAGRLPRAASCSAPPTGPCADRAADSALDANADEVRQSRYDGYAANKSRQSVGTRGCRRRRQDARRISNRPTFSWAGSTRTRPNPPPLPGGGPGSPRSSPAAASPPQHWSPPGPPGRARSVVALAKRIAYVPNSASRLSSSADAARARVDTARAR